MDTFDIGADLNPGTTLLEASAGTGKTWTIAALVAKQVASGEVRLDEMLVVTFTRAASQELRERVRRQLDEAVQLLADPGLRDPANRLHDWLLDAADDEVARRLDRLTAALVSFDAATIATIHQFCQLVLRSLGVAGDTDASATLVEDLEQLTTEVVDDLYLAQFGQDEKPPWTRAAALELARTVVGDPRAVVEPADAVTASPDSAAAMRVRFACAVLEEVERRKRRLGILSYDDLLSQLADALEDERAPARLRMQHRWKFVLIDEFQDTDPVQWQVFRRAFSETTTMVLIGDPKQAIYAFRGGDIVTYLQAAETATTVQTLGVNWRSDGPLLDSVHAVLRGARLGDERIVVHPVDAHRRSSRLQGAGAPFRLRVVRRSEIGKGPRSKPPVALWRDHVIADTAHDIKRLVESRPTFDDRALRPGDIAVLAARRNELEAVQHALAQVGVPAVVNAGGSVFHTPAAGEWVALLEALEQPHRADRVRAAALTSFFGHDAASLDAGGDDLTDRLADRVRQLADVFTQRGVAAVVEVAAAEGLTARVLARVGGERTLTDLRHIGESLLRVSTEERLGLVGLLAWLREQVADDKLEVASERTRRLDSDAEAVQLVTIHGSKGLQYPVVYLPTLWNRFTGREPVVPLYHDDAGRRCRDVGGPSAFRSEPVARHWREDAGESLRLLYVAMTRAQSQVVAWYAAAERNTPDSPLHRVLFGRRPGMAAVPDSQALVDEERLMTILAAWQDAGGPSIELAPLVPPDPTPLRRSTDSLAVREFTRSVDTAWRRTSYSSLSAASASHAAAALSEPEDLPDEDSTVSADDLVDAAAASAPTPAASVPSPMATLPVGATFGSLVHAVLEHADPAVEDFRGELLRLIEEQLVWWPVELDPTELADALVAVCSSPLGPLAADRTLLSLGLADRLRELDFEVPLAGGDTGTPAADVRLGDLAPLLRRHLPEGDAVRVYADALDADPDLSAQSLRGYLTGSIDVVLRLDVDGAQRFLTVDYKTNWLGPLDQPLTAHDYRPEMLDEAMAHSDYPLQALLYTVVLHRFLRWRLPAYDPATHLGGVLYLYLRGMCGPETPVVDGMPCGVFSWRPPVALVEELSDLLDGVRVGVAVG
jgi:exodeoxyribonuclease V beta subunit